MDDIKLIEEIAINLARSIQRLERENVDITVEDIENVWKLKTYLGIAHPTSIEEGTGAMISKKSNN